VNNKVKQNQSSQDLAHQVQEAELLQEQMTETELMEANEQYELSGYSDKRDLANQLVGRIQMAYGFTKLATVSSLTDLAYVKEHKLYKALAGKKINGQELKEETVATWEAFCNALGMSRRKVDEDLMNLTTFGEEALDAMNKAGIGYRQMLQLRKLPEKELTIVVNEVEANVGDKDAILGLIEDISIKHAKEKESLQQQVEQAQSKNEANEKFLQTKEQKINDLEKVVNKCMTADEERKHKLDQEQQLKNELSFIEAECSIAIEKLDLAIGKIYNQSKCSEELEQMPSKLYEFLLKRLVNVADEYGMQYDAHQILSPILFNLSNASVQESKE